MIRRKGKAWVAQVYIGRTPDGRKRYVSRSCGSHSEARRVEAQLLTEVTTGKRRPAVTHTVGELFDEWLATADLSPSTLYGYQRLVEQRLRPAFGETRLDRLTPKMLEEFFARLRTSHRADGAPLSPATVRNVHAILRRALTKGFQWGWLHQNPMAHIPPPKQLRRPPRTPPIDDLDRMLDQAAAEDADLHALLRLTISTGARRSEICGLRWSDFDESAGRLLIERAVVEAGGQLYVKPTKTHASRLVQLDEQTAALLAAMKRRAEKRAVTCNGTLPPSAFVGSTTIEGDVPLRPGVLSKRLRRLARAGRIDGWWLHGARHAAATMMISSGIDVRTTAGRLGHADATMTLRVYSHVLPGADAAAAEAIARRLG